MKTVKNTAKQSLKFHFYIYLSFCILIPRLPRTVSYNIRYYIEGLIFLKDSYIYTNNDLW